MRHYTLYGEKEFAVSLPEDGSEGMYYVHLISENGLDAAEIMVRASSRIEAAALSYDTHPDMILLDAVKYRFVNN